MPLTRHLFRECSLYVLILLGMTSCASMHVHEKAITLYVAPSGDDHYPGTRSKPLRSPEHARDVLRELKQNKTLQSPATVYLRGGEYLRSSVFRLEKEDSGTEHAPVVYCAYPGEKVRWAGGIPLHQEWFSSVNDAAVAMRFPDEVRKHILCANLREKGVSEFGDPGPMDCGLRLICDGRMLPRAQWPNKGYAEARSKQTAGLDDTAAEALAKEHKLGDTVSFLYEGPGPRVWPSLQNVFLCGYWQQEYMLEAWTPLQVDSVAKEIRMPYELFGNLQQWRRFYVTNVPEELDMPGEWYLDWDSGVLYVYPPDDFQEGLIYVSMFQDTMLELADASNITVAGITFEASRGMGIQISGGEHNRIAGCTIRCMRRGAVISGGTDNGLISCDIYDLEAMGVLLEGGDRQTLEQGGHILENCHIHHYARTVQTWQPGVQVKGVGNRVRHCLIHHAPQYAISYEGNDHLFEYNELHHLCMDMSDVGVIGCGTNWTYRGTIIRYNYIHDIPARPYPGVVSVYFDNCASSATVFGNIFFKMEKAVMIGGGRDHIIENNLFIECKTPVYMDNRGLRWGHFQPGGPMYKDLEAMPYQQPPWSTRYPELARILDEIPQAPLGNVLRRNVSIRSGWCNPEEVCRKMFKNNIERPYLKIEDNLALEEDPEFCGGGDFPFELPPDSFIYKRFPGFQPIPFRNIGLYADQYRAK
ncbi:MAG TPA: right-handed parallel beta-helix repeat-containing protein [Candidatus Hydrogenedentes bacterium]|nr:right-handed parallel beta-helix repeat-containing protein [Candidatus Hydrogenedentota bacterium]